MLFYDFEVFKYDWLTVIFDTDNRKEHVIINDADQLQKIYDDNKNIWLELSAIDGKQSLIFSNSSSQIFSIYDDESENIGISAKGHTFLLTDSSSETVSAKGTWDFSNATIIWGDNAP